MEQKLEPTTGEIVEDLRDEEVCQYVYWCDKAADRLESQEREIERLKEELEQMEEAATVLHAANETHWTYIKELAARAEQAERQRDSYMAGLEDALRQQY